LACRIGVPSAARRGTEVLGYAIPITTVRDFLKDNCLMTEDDEKCLEAKKAEKAKKKDE